MGRNTREEDNILFAQSTIVTTIDITNESLIVGIATTVGELGNPSSLTPGSRETILRNQVKTLLRKVEEEDDNVSTISLVPYPQHLFHGLSPSPMALLAPTPANTPLIPNLLNSVGDDVMGVGGDVQNFKNTQFLIDFGISFSHLRRLLMKPLIHPYCSTIQGACVWSIEVPKSSKGEKEEEDDNGEEEEESDYEDGYGDEKEGEEIEELCDGLRKLSVVEKKEMTKFKGWNT
ncbi:hypothetical protein ACLOJK_006021 [Asimina triloba]